MPSTEPVILVLALAASAVERDVGNVNAQTLKRQEKCWLITHALGDESKPRCKRCVDAGVAECQYVTRVTFLQRNFQTVGTVSQPEYSTVQVYWIHDKACATSYTYTKFYEIVCGR